MCVSFLFLLFVYVLCLVLFRDIVTLVVMLFFMWCRKLTDFSLKAIAENCPNLRTLDISNLCKLTDYAIGYLANGCHGIQTLKLCRNVFRYLRISMNSVKQYDEIYCCIIMHMAKLIHVLFCLVVLYMLWCVSKFSSF